MNLFGIELHDFRLPKHCLYKGDEPRVGAVANGEAERQSIYFGRGSRAPIRGCSTTCKNGCESVSRWESLPPEAPTRHAGFAGGNNRRGTWGIGRVIWYIVINGHRAPVPSLVPQTGVGPPTANSHSQMEVRQRGKAHPADRGEAQVGISSSGCEHGRTGSRGWFARSSEP